MNRNKIFIILIFFLVVYFLIFDYFFNNPTGIWLWLIEVFTSSTNNENTLLKSLPLMLVFGLVCPISAYKVTFSTSLTDVDLKLICLIFVFFIIYSFKVYFFLVELDHSFLFNFLLGLFPMAKAHVLYFYIFLIDSFIFFGGLIILVYLLIKLL